MNQDDGQPSKIMCKSNYACWGNGECNSFLNTPENCFDGGDCSYRLFFIRGSHYFIIQAKLTIVGLLTILQWSQASQKNILNKSVFLLPTNCRNCKKLSKSSKIHVYLQVFEYSSIWGHSSILALLTIKILLRGFFWIF